MSRLANPMDDPVGTLCAEVGEDAIKGVVAAFYRQIPHDDVLGPMYPNGDFAGAERRLADFLIVRCGGSDRYLRERGHPRLRMRHAKFAVDQAARDRWMELMSAALESSELPQGPRERLRQFLDGVATFLMNR